MTRAAEARAHFDAAMAELRRVEGLFRGPLTEGRRDALALKLTEATFALAIARMHILAAEVEPEPLPNTLASFAEAKRQADALRAPKTLGGARP